MREVLTVSRAIDAWLTQNTTNGRLPTTKEIDARAGQLKQFVAEKVGVQPAGLKRETLADLAKRAVQQKRQRS